MTYVATIYIPVKNPNRDMRVFSKECALEQLENIKKYHNVIDSEWVDGDLMVKFEVEV